MTSISDGGRTGLGERIAGAGASSIWVGDRVQLRAREPEDSQPTDPLFHDTDTQRSGWMVQVPESRAAQRARVEREAEAGVEAAAVEFSLVVARREDNVPVGGINTHGVDPANGVFSYGVGILPAHQRNGYAAEAIVLLLRFMFFERRFQKCQAQVYDYNTASQALHRRLGFVEEGRLRRRWYLGGEYRDEVVFGMIDEEFRALYPALRIDLG